MPHGWEGNRRYGVSLAMRNRLQWFIHLRAHGLRKGDEHPAYTHHGVWHSFTLLGYIGSRTDGTRSSAIAEGPRDAS